MRFLLDLDSRLGITRSDVTVLLFLTTAALVGFIYVTFFEARSPAVERRELRALIRRHDSILDLHRRQALAPLDSARLHPDSVPVWTPAGAGSPGDTVGRMPERPGRRKEELKGPIDINHASITDLMRLPGIGASTAAAIIETRRDSLFASAADIMRVPGIGAKKYAKLKPYILVR